MRALYASGRQHDALGAYQRARRGLADLGLEPGAELPDTERRILEQDASLTPASGRSMLAAALRSSTPLVGRVDERRRLAMAWQSATSGIGQCRILSGPLESGRTRLAADIAGRALADGGAVEYARGDDLLAALGASPWSSPAKADFGPLVDEIANRCRRTPLLLVVDDAEWATGAAVDLVRALAASVDQIAMLLLLVVDPSGGGPAVAAISRLDPTGAATIDVPLMRDDELAAVIGADGVDSGAVTGILAVSNGLPGVARREAAAWAERTASEPSARRSGVVGRRARRRHDGRRRPCSMRSSNSSPPDARRTSCGAPVGRAASRTGRLPATGPRTPSCSSAANGSSPSSPPASWSAGWSSSSVLGQRQVVPRASRAGAAGAQRPLARRGGVAAHVIVPGDDPLAALDVIDELDEPGPRLLVVDQFEEAFARRRTARSFGATARRPRRDPGSRRPRRPRRPLRRTAALAP